MVNDEQSMNVAAQIVTAKDNTMRESNRLSKRPAIIEVIAAAVYSMEIGRAA